MGKETIIPFSRSGVKSTVERFFIDGLGIDDVWNTFDTVYPLESGEQDLPCLGLTGTRRSHQHKTMRYILDLIELNDFIDPFIAGDQVLLLANLFHHGGQFL
jgi:hypothetical protein